MSLVICLGFERSLGVAIAFSVALFFLGDKKAGKRTMLNTQVMEDMRKSQLESQDHR